MHCPKCGTEARDGWSFCERCGHQIGIPQLHSPRFQAPFRKNVKRVWAAVIAGAIAMTLVSSLLLFYLAISPPSIPLESSFLSRTKLGDGYKWTFGGASVSQRELPWRWDNVDISVDINGGGGGLGWLPTSNALTDTAAGLAREYFDPQSLGTVMIWCNVTDAKGNGQVDMGDYFTLTTSGSQPFVAGTTYNLLVGDRSNPGYHYIETFSG